MLYYEYQLDNEMLHILYMILTYLKVSVYTLMYTYIIYIYCMNIYNLWIIVNILYTMCN